MVKISSALSAEGVIAYHKEQYVSNYERYYSQSGEAHGIWFGKEAGAFGLGPGTPVAEEHFRRLANGQDPQTGLQLIAWRTNEPKEPRWLRDDAAWRKQLEDLFTAAVEDRREVFREGVGGAKLERSAKSADNISAAGRTHSGRVQALLEMHRIARETFESNLAGEGGAGARLYLKERGIRLETAKEFGLGLADASGQQLVEKLKHFGPELMEASGLFIKRGNEFVDR